VVDVDVAPEQVNPVVAVAAVLIAVKAKVAAADAAVINFLSVSFNTCIIYP